jgi:hypothetical protein
VLPKLLKLLVLAATVPMSELQAADPAAHLAARPAARLTAHERPLPLLGPRHAR